MILFGRKLTKKLKSVENILFLPFFVVLVLAMLAVS